MSRASDRIFLQRSRAQWGIRTSFGSVSIIEPGRIASVIMTMNRRLEIWMLPSRMNMLIEGTNIWKWTRMNGKEHDIATGGWHLLLLTKRFSLFSMWSAITIPQYRWCGIIVRYRLLGLFRNRPVIWPKYSINSPRTYRTNISSR